MLFPHRIPSESRGDKKLHIIVFAQGFPDILLFINLRTCIEGSYYFIHS